MSLDLGISRDTSGLAPRLAGRSRKVPQYTGKVVWFNNAKGFGFLSHEGGSDVFVHFSAIRSDGYKALKENDPVEFDVETGTSGKAQAANVKVLKDILPPGRPEG